MSTDQPPSSGAEDPFAKRPQEPGEPSGPGEPGGPGAPRDQPPPSYPPPPPPPAGGEYPSGGGPYAGGPYGEYGAGEPDPLRGMPPLANRGRRLVARIVDALIIGIPIWLITWLAWGGYDYQDNGEAIGQSVIYAVVYLGYQVFMLTRYGQSLGKMLMKIRVGMLADGSRPTPPAALAREAVYALVPLVPCCGTVFWIVEVLWCTWDKPYRQCLHDKAGKTVVVSSLVTA